MNSSCDHFIDNLLYSAPELRHLYDEHLNDYNGLLPHVFFGDVTRFMLKLVQKDNIDSRQVANRILILFESAIVEQDEDVQNLILVSFLENITPDDEGHEELVKLFGPHLKAEYVKKDYGGLKE